MLLFLCETKAQIVNAIALKMSLFKNDKADVCLSRKIAMPVEYEIRLRELKLFEEVFSFEPYYNPNQDFKSMVKKSIRNVTMVKDVAKMLDGKLRENYTRVFISGPGTACPAVYYAIRKMNPRVKLSLYEEGVFEYYLFDYPWNTKRRWYSRLFYGCFYLDEAEDLFVYAPNMVVNAPNDLKIKPIPAIYENDNYKKCVNHVFAYNDSGLENLENFQYIFIDSCFNELSLEQAQQNVVRILYNNVGEKMIVKMHPRSDFQKYDDIGVNHLKTNQSLEMILLNHSFNVENVVFVSLVSSALFNIKLMFRKEPRIVLLNDLFGKSSGEETGFQLMAKQFVDRYKKGYIFHPQNLEELREVMDKMNNQKSHLSTIS